MLGDRLYKHYTVNRGMLGARLYKHYTLNCGMLGARLYKHYTINRGMLGARLLYNALGTLFVFVVLFISFCYSDLYM